MASEPASRPPLSRERILRAALELADESGIDAVTMRGLGQVLGFEAMSLYHHVASKVDLLDGVLDLVLAEGEPPSPAEPWDAAIRRSAISVHDSLRRHPWAAMLLMAPERIRPARLRYMDSLLGRLREGGFPAETTFVAYHVLDGHIFGFSLWETSHTYDPAEAAAMVDVFEQTITVEEYPYLHEHARQHFDEGPHREASAFELGLDLILDGLRKLLDAG